LPLIGYKNEMTTRMTNTTTSTSRQQGNRGQLLAAATRKPQQVDLEDH